MPSARVVEFVALLREHGFTLGVQEQQAMLSVAVQLGVTRERSVAAAWRAIACQRRREWRLWPELYEGFWHPQRVRGTVKVSGQTRPRRDLRQAVSDLHAQMATAASPASAAQSHASADAPATSASQEPGLARAQGGASAVEALHNREGQMWWPQELGELQQLARRIHARLRPRPTRRWQPAQPGDRLDLRRTLRRSVALGGEPLGAAWQVRRTERPRLFILVDVSRSMESHAAFCLRVARAFAREAGARVFVFHTRLAEVTALMHRDSARVQEKINAVTAGFGGGTRIAACLQAFLHSDARAQLQGASRVWVCSDGFDTDAPDDLREALQALRRRGARLTWFHPTRGAPVATAFTQARACLEACLPLAGLADLRAAQFRLQ
jgi:uncharacterized protein with von Willebrand factor type A (vWA) domain